MPKAVEITLTPVQQERAAANAERHYESARRKHIENRRGPKPQKRDYYLLGAEGELSAHLYTRLPWTSEFFPWLVDLGDDVEIKTRAEAWHDLPVYRDKLTDAWRYVLVTGEARPTFRLRGWLFGHECRRLCYHIEKENNVGDYVDQDRLHDIETLLPFPKRPLELAIPMSPLRVACAFCGSLDDPHDCPVHVERGLSDAKGS